MNLKEFVELYAETNNVTKKESKEFIDGFFATVEKALLDRQELKLNGFGNFSIVEVGEREKRNPATNEVFTAPAKTVVKFKLSKKLKEVLN